MNWNVDHLPKPNEFAETYHCELPRVVSQVKPEHPKADRQVLGVIVQRGERTLMNSLPKMGKTETARQWITMMGCGQVNPYGEDLGSITKGQALILSEEPDSVWDESRERLGIGDHVCILNKRNVAGMDWDTICAYSASLAKHVGFDLVVVDTITAFAGIQNENDNSEVTKVVQATDIITSTGAGLLLIHHLRKAKGSSGTQTRGGGAFLACVDTSLEIRSVKDHPRRRRFTTLSRHGYIPDVFDLEMIDGAYHRVQGRGTGSSASNERQRIILALLPAEPPGLTWEEILEKWPATDSKPSRTRLCESLKVAEDKGLIVSDGKALSDRKKRRYWTVPSCALRQSPATGTVPEKAPQRTQETIPIEEESYKRDAGTVGQSTALHHPKRKIKTGMESQHRQADLSTIRAFDNPTGQGSPEEGAYS